MKPQWIITLVLVGACYGPANNSQPMYAQPQAVEPPPQPQVVEPQLAPPQVLQPQTSYYGSDEQLEEHLTDDDYVPLRAPPPPSGNYQGSGGVVGSSAGASVSIHVNGQSQSYCYNHSYNGFHTGQKCFGDKASYCTSMCNESNPLSARACRNECAPPAPPMPSPNAI